MSRFDKEIAMEICGKKCYSKMLTFLLITRKEEPAKPTWKHYYLNQN